MDPIRFEIKKLSAASIPEALEKVKRYRLLNEPGEAESICRDILATDAAQHEARISLILALSDQFERGAAGRFEEARSLVNDLADEYERAYYSGILAERRAKAVHRQGGIGCGAVAFEWFQQAMHCFEAAEELRPEGKDVAILRWNACARKIMNHAELRPDPHEGSHGGTQDDF